MKCIVTYANTNGAISHFILCEILEKIIMADYAPKAIQRWLMMWSLK